VEESTSPRNREQCPHDARCKLIPLKADSVVGCAHHVRRDPESIRPSQARYVEFNAYLSRNADVGSHERSA
jgi:hypothetical protein